VYLQTRSLAPKCLNFGEKVKSVGLIEFESVVPKCMDLGDKQENDAQVGSSR